MNGFLTGVGCVFRGLVRLVVTPALWGYAWAPVLVTAGVFMYLIHRLSVLGRDRVSTWAHETFGGSGWADWVVGIAAWTLGVVGAFFVFGMLVRVVAAPFLALLADRTVAGLIGRASPAAPGSAPVRWVIRPALEALLLLGIRLVITVLALPLLLIPVAGAVLFGVVSMGLLGLDLIDIAQSGRGILLGARLSFFRRHMAACLGLGMGAGVLFLVPCVNVLFLPAAVVAAVLLDQRIAPDFPKAAAA